MISMLVAILAWKGGLGFSILLGTSGVFYLSVSKKRLDNQHSISKEDVDTVVSKDDEGLKSEDETEELEL